MKLKILSLILSLLSTSFIVKAEGPQNFDDKTFSISLFNEHWIYVEQPTSIDYTVNQNSFSDLIVKKTDFCVSSNSDYTLTLTDFKSQEFGYSTFNLFTKSFSTEFIESNPNSLKRSIPFYARLVHNKVVGGVSNPSFVNIGSVPGNEFSDSFTNPYSAEPDLDVNDYSNSCISKTTGEKVTNYSIDIKVNQEDVEKARSGYYVGELNINATINTEIANCTAFPEESECSDSNVGV